MAALVRQQSPQGDRKGGPYYTRAGQADPWYGRGNLSADKFPNAAQDNHRDKAHSDDHAQNRTRVINGAKPGCAVSEFNVTNCYNPGAPTATSSFARLVLTGIPACARSTPESPPNLSNRNNGDAISFNGVTKYGSDF